MAVNPTSVDPDELYKNFRDLVFEKFGKKLSDKDPIILQFLMHEMFTKNLADRLNEFCATSTGKLSDLADLWKEREDQSFASLKQEVEASVRALKTFVDGDVKSAIYNIYKTNGDTLNQNMINQFESMKAQLKVTNTVTIVCSLIVGIVLGFLACKGIGF